MKELMALKEPLVDAFWDLFRKPGFYGLLAVVVIGSKLENLPLLKMLLATFVPTLILYFLTFLVFLKRGKRSGY